MIKKPPAFQFYAQDFLTGVMYLTNEEIGIYMKMLCKQWTDGKIPKKRLGFLVGLDWDNFSDELKEKFEDKGDFLVNPRLEIERDKQLKNREKNQENGKKGGRPRKTPPSEPQENSGLKPNENPTVSKTESELKAKKSPSSEDEVEIEDEIENEKRGDARGDLVFPYETENFLEQWWQWKLYKRKEFGFKYKSIQSEQAALTKINNLSKTPEEAIAIIHQSMASGWKGFFQLKQNANEQSNQAGSVYSNDFKQRVAGGLVPKEN